MTTEQKYQYGVINRRSGDLWRGPYDTMAEAVAWIAESMDLGVPERIFYMVKRTVGEWEPCD